MEGWWVDIMLIISCLLIIRISPLQLQPELVEDPDWSFFSERSSECCISAAPSFLMAANEVPMKPCDVSLQQMIVIRFPARLEILNCSNNAVCLPKVCSTHTKFSGNPLSEILDPPLVVCRWLGMPFQYISYIFWCISFCKHKKVCSY